MRIGLMAVSSSTGLFWPATVLAASLAAQGERTALIAITTPEQAAAAGEAFRCPGSYWSLYDLSSGACNAGQALVPSGFSPAVDVIIEPSVAALAMPNAAVARVLDRVFVTHRHLVVVCGGEGWPRAAQGWLGNVDHNLLLCSTRIPEIRSLLADGDWPPADSAAFLLWSEWGGGGSAEVEQPTPQALAQLLGLPLFGVFDPKSTSSPGQAAELLAAVRRLQQATAAPAERQQQLKARLADTLQRDRARLNRPSTGDGLDLTVDLLDNEAPVTPFPVVGAEATTPDQAPIASEPAVPTPGLAEAVVDPAVPTARTATPLVKPESPAVDLKTPSTVPDSPTTSFAALAPVPKAPGAASAAPASSLPSLNRPDAEEVAASVLSIGSALMEITQLRQDVSGRLAEGQAYCRLRAIELQAYLTRFTDGAEEAAVTSNSKTQPGAHCGIEPAPTFDLCAVAAELHATDQQVRTLTRRLAEIDGQADAVAKLVRNWLEELRVG